MARAEFPRVVDSKRERKWIDQGPNKGPKCRVCGDKATHSSTVQVNWFRGDDEGPFKACEAHKNDAQALLNPPIQEKAA